MNEALRPQLADAAGACRRCSECQGEAHHWSDILRDDAGDFLCRHCDHVEPSAECSACGEDVPEAVTRLCDGDERVCGGCIEPGEAG